MRKPALRIADRARPIGFGFGQIPTDDAEAALYFCRALVGKSPEDR
jgi:hypothetical protein